MDFLQTLLFGVAGLMILTFILIIGFIFVIYIFVKKLMKNGRDD